MSYPSIEFSSLPAELRLNIFNYLPLNERFVAMRVCRSWHKMLHEPSLWNYLPPFEWFKDCIGKTISLNRSRTINGSVHSIVYRTDARFALIFKKLQSRWRGYIVSLLDERTCPLQKTFRSCPNALFTEQGLAVESSQGKISFWCVKTGKKLKKERQVSIIHNGIDAADGLIVVHADEPKERLAWHMRTGHSACFPSALIRSYPFSWIKTAGDIHIAAYPDSKVLFWSRKNWRKLGELAILGELSPLRDLQDSIVYGYGGGVNYLVSALTGQMIGRLEGMGTLYSTKELNEDIFLFSYIEDHIRCWKLGAPCPIFQIKPHPSLVNTMLLINDLLFLGCDDGTIDIWDVKRSARVQTLTLQKSSSIRALKVFGATLVVGTDHNIWRTFSAAGDKVNGE